jgi:autotransporter-associated beta strand protein
LNTVAVGGGAGGSSSQTPQSGGSGGGSNSASAGATGTLGQGNTGGTGVQGSTDNLWAGGGGGAAGAAGQSARLISSNATAGNGGAGLASSISGNQVFYAGGGGGGLSDNSSGAAGEGGLGGGGRGGRAAAGTNAANNTGSGGGGGGHSNSIWAFAGGNGGSGIVIVRYLGVDAADGGTETTGSNLATGYRLHTFTSIGSSTLTFNALEVNFSGTISGGNSLTVNATGGTVMLTGTNTYTGNTTISGGTLVIGGSGSLNSGNYTGTISNAGTLKYSSSTDQILSGVISSTGSLIKDTSTSSLLNLSGANTYTGSTTISAGVLKASNAAALGATSTGTTVANGAALEITTSINTEPLTLNGSGISNGGALRNISGDNSYTGLITQASNSRINSDSGTLTLDVSGNAITGTHNLTFGGAGNITVTDPIATSTGTLTKDGSGILTFSAANTYSGTTTISAGTLVLQNNAPNPTSKTFAGSGTLRIQSVGDSFTSAFTTSGWNFGSALSSLIIGKSTNTASITLASATTLAGQISVYGGTIAINDNINTSTGTISGDVLLKASGDISVAAGKSITTSGAKVTLWSDSDAVSGGNISLGSGSSIQTSGGLIVLAGGSDNGANGGTSGDGIPDGYARGVDSTGISTSGSFTISAGAGSILMRGSSNLRDGVLLAATTTGNITTTSGRIDILGFVDSAAVSGTNTNTQTGIRTASGGVITIDSGLGVMVLSGEAPRYGVGFGVNNTSGTDTTQTIVKSANTTSAAISITGSGNRINSGHGISFRGTSSKIYASASLGGITLTGTSSAWSSTVYSPIEVLAVSGPIRWLNSDSADGIFSAGASIALGSKSGVTGLTTSSSDITIYLKKWSAAPTFAIGSTGAVSIQGVNGTRLVRLSIAANLG